ncbi:MAG: cytochrome c biogenesis protein CcdA [Thermoplasmata archaeon]|nr:cytochrome c biogenesis protein CcdA [Thermoplasmata archaeon]
MVDPVLLTFAYGAGVLSFFSPCAFPMLPAYISYYLARDAPAEDSLSQGLKFGGLSTLGMLIIFAGLGSLLGLVGGSVLGGVIPLFGLGMGVMLVALGVLLLGTNRLGFTLPLRAPVYRGPLSFFLYGIAYALVSLGCTFPIFVVLVTAALLSGGLASGLLVFTVYSLGLGTVMVFLSIAVATSRDVVAEQLHRVVPWVRIISAVVLLAVGGYMVYYYWPLVGVALG